MSAGRSGRRRGASQPEETRSSRLGSCCIKARARERGAQGAQGAGRAAYGWASGLGPAGGNSAGRAAQPPPAASPPRPPPSLFSPNSGGADWLGGAGEPAGGQPRAPISAGCGWKAGLRESGRSGRVAGPGMRPLLFPTPAARVDLFPGFLKCSPYIESGSHVCFVMNGLGVTPADPCSPLGGEG